MNNEYIIFEFDRFYNDRVQFCKQFELFDFFTLKDFYSEIIYFRNNIVDLTLTNVANYRFT